MPSISLPTIAMDIGLSAEAVTTASEIGATVGSIASTVGSVASVVAPIAGIAGAGLSAYGRYSQGQQQAASSNYNAAVQANNAQIQQQNATVAAQVGQEQTAQAQQKTRAEIGAIKATQAANGLDINSGSNVDVRSSAAELGELNAITVRSNAARVAYGYETQAQSDSAQSQLSKEEAGYASKAGDIGAASTLLGGLYQGGTSGWLKYNANNSLNGQ